MPRAHPITFPDLRRLLAALGECLRVARLRRNYGAVTVAARAGLARATRQRGERGDPSVSMATYATVPRELSLYADVDLIAHDDVPGRKLQDFRLPMRRRASNLFPTPTDRAPKTQP